MVSRAPSGTAAKAKSAQQSDKPVFEMVVLGSGGGPLETDCSG